MDDDEKCFIESECALGDRSIDQFQSRILFVRKQPSDKVNVLLKVFFFHV